jgi:hypothetical protein
MPNVFVPLKDTVDSIERMVVVDIAKELCHQTGLPERAKIYFFNGNDGALQPGTEAGGGVGDVSATDFALSITVERETREESTMASAIYREEDQPIFTDKPLNIVATPIYEETQFRLAIKARFADKTSAELWRQRLKSNASKGQRIRMHRASYHYAIPNFILIALSEIYTLRERRAGYGQTLQQWMLEGLTKRARTLTDSAGGNPMLAVSETQINIQAMFDFLSKPEPVEVDKEKGTWEATFGYVFVMQMPYGVTFKYPHFIHNQTLTKRLRFTDTPYALSKEIPYFSKSGILMETLRGTETDPVDTLGVSYPNWDDWLPAYEYPSTAMLIRIAVAVPVTDLRDLYDLSDMGDYAFDPKLVDYMRGAGSSLGLMRKAAIKVSLYEGDCIKEEIPLVINSDLQVRSPVDLDLRKQYHVVVSVLYDLTILTEAAKDYLRSKGDFLIDLLTLLYPGLAKDGLLPPLLSNGSVGKKDFDEIINIIKDYYIVTYDKANFRPRFVNSATIVGQRQEATNG